MKTTKHDQAIGFVKHYCTMIRIGNQGRLTPESIALEKLLDALIKRFNRK